MSEQIARKSTNKNPDPVISLTRQFNKLMLGNSTLGVKDRPEGGWIKLDGTNPNLTPQNRKYELLHYDEEGRKVSRYDRGDRIYQMQVDFCYLIAAVRSAQGRNAAIRQCQEFINGCKEELTRI
jgi:hypothetical protein